MFGAAIKIFPAFRFVPFAVLALMALFAAALCGCAGSKASHNTETAVAEVAAVPDSLRAKFKLTLLDKSGKEQELDAVLFSVPGKRYRMELTGAMGIGVASMLWQEEGWQVVFPTEKMYVKGAGYMVGIFSDSTIPMVHIHQVASVFEGKLLPEGYKDVGDGKAVEPNGREFSYGKEGNDVAWIRRTGRDGKPETVRFDGFKEFEGTRLPAHVVFERNGKKYLEIQVKTVKHGQAFSLGVWRLNIPKSYQRIE
ncbi:MAG: hypothetical protein J6U20_09115 [Fibrobacter sp.]|nr:hypothetical protein [Fibrobacter sp.]